MICVGETEAQRKKGETLKVVRAQLAAVIAEGLKIDGPASPIIAYEPVWAIGTGKACSGQEAMVVHEAIHDALVKKFGKEASEIPVIYGGSVDPRNVAEYLSTTHIDGVLIGSASLDPRAFGVLCRAALPA